MEKSNSSLLGKKAPVLQPKQQSSCTKPNVTRLDSAEDLDAEGERRTTAAPMMRVQIDKKLEGHIEQVTPSGLGSKLDDDDDEPSREHNEIKLDFEQGSDRPVQRVQTLEQSQIAQLVGDEQRGTTDTGMNASVGR